MHVAQICLDFHNPFLRAKINKPCDLNSALPLMTHLLHEKVQEILTGMG